MVGANLWAVADENCQVCGARIGSPLTGQHPGDFHEDGTLRTLSGYTLEEAHPYDGLLSLCEECLRMVINQEFLDLHQRAVRAEELGLK